MTSQEEDGGAGEEMEGQQTEQPWLTPVNLHSTHALVAQKMILTHSIEDLQK